MPCSAWMNLMKALRSADFAGIEAGRRLVEAEQRRLGAHGARDLQAPLRPVRQIAGRLVGALQQRHLVQPIPGEMQSPRLGLSVGAHAEKSHHRPSRGAHQRVVLGDDQIFQHGHAREQANILERTGDPGMGRDLVVRHALEQVDGARGGPSRSLPRDGERLDIASGRRVAERQQDASAARLVEARQAVEDRRLARAVGADDRGDLAARRHEGRDRRPPPARQSACSDARR